MVLGAEGLECRGAVALGVVRQQPLASNAEAVEPTQCSAEEPSGTDSILGGMDLGVGQTAVVIDADEDDLPARASTSLAAIAVNGVSDPLDTAEALRIDMEQAPRVRVLVALRRVLGLLDAPETAEAFGLEMAGVPRAQRYARARDMIASVGLKHFEEKRCSQLSGGMRQRVALARALVMDQPILLMDEPFAALDAQTKIVMQEELTRIFERTRKTILFVTHAIDEAILLGDEVVVMTARPGRIKEVIKIDLPRPRSQELINTPEFGDLYDRILHLIREEVLNAMQQQNEAAEQ